MQASDEYELLDVGDGARLERFGDRTVDRPHPVALGARHDPAAWAAADLRFDRERGWTGPAVTGGPWPVKVAGLSMELRPTDTGQVGLFPEHLRMVPWLQQQLERPNPGLPMARAANTTDADEPAPPRVLHLFAYTGLATLAMAAAGAGVTHVDSARPTVAWARRNATLSGLEDRPVRWIVDDAMAFVQRERRRGRRYDGLVLDPPSYGHGPSGQPWRLGNHLDVLLEAAAALLAPDGFVLLTAHMPGFDGDVLATHVARARARSAAAIERGDLALETVDGRQLEVGAFARWPAGAS